MKRWLYLVLISFALLPGCAESDDPTRSNTFTPLTSIEIVSPAPFIANGTSIQLSAIGNFSGAFTRDITSEVTWAPAAAAPAIVSNAVDTRGRASAKSPGTVTITATLEGITASFDLTVTNATITLLQVSPVNPSVPKGLKQQFKATGTFDDGSTLSTQDLTFDAAWSSSNSAIAVIGDAPGNKGLATGVDVGTADITATFGGQSDATTLEVTPAVLQSISVTPQKPTIANLTTLQFAATGAFSDSTTQDLTSQATWSSARGDVATISSSGLATGVNPGISRISAALSGVTGSTDLTVTGAALQSITVTPGNFSMADLTTLQFTATGSFADGSTEKITSLVTWSSSDSAVATISNAAGTKGLAAAVAPGVPVTITAAFGTISGTTFLTVTSASLQSIAIQPVDAAIARDTTRQFTARGTFGGVTQDITRDVAWSSSDLSVATLSSQAGEEGLARGLAAGTATITAAFGTVSATTSLTVIDAALTEIVITPLDPAIAVGRTQQFTAAGTFAGGSTQDITRDVTWSSSDANVATFSSQAGEEGLARGLAAGTATITAAKGAVTASTTLRVD